jgi:4a-hydroxytetrahydrobiopterin dehydratase
MSDLTTKKCVPCETDAAPLQKEDVLILLKEIPGWKASADFKNINKEYMFTGFADAMAFANKIAIVADQESHHPDLTVSWGKVYAEISTHSVGGLSENDFILAAKIDAL